jgi:hypothetical protein
MIKRVIFPIVLVAVLATGCVTVRIENKINKDGSGTKSFVLALDKSVISMFESMGEEAGATTEDIWETARSGAESIQGATVEQFSDEDREGIRVSVPFASLDELQALSGSDAFEGADVVTISRDGDKTTLRATVDTGDFSSGLGQGDLQGLEGVDLGDIDIEFSYVVEVEGEILEYAPHENAQATENKVTWDLTQSGADAAELMVTWQPGGGLDTTAIVLIVAAAGGVILVGAGAVLTLRDRKKPDQLTLNQDAPT